MVASRRAAYAEEAAEVEVLLANLDKMKTLTKKIQGSVGRLEVSGKTVQEAISPVYGNTQRLQVTNSNVNRILEAIEKMRQPLDMKNREERILRARPDRIGLAEYIASMERTSTALRNLQATNLRTNQPAIAELSTLLRVATQNLEEVFAEMCRQDSAAIEPLRYITKSADFPRLSSQKQQQLRVINAQVAGIHLASRSSPDELSPVAKAYVRERGQYMTLSLQNLAAASLSTARKVSASDVYKPGSNAIGTYASGMQGMFIAEFDSVNGVFTNEERGRVFSATCGSALGAFSSTLRDLNRHITNNLLTDCFLAYEIVDVVTRMSFQLDDQTRELKDQISDSLRPIRDTAKSSMYALLNDTKGKISSLMSLPVDGSSVPITFETMQRMQHMVAFLDPVRSILRSLGGQGWRHPQNIKSATSIPTLKSFDVGADGDALFQEYANDVIEALLMSLDQRGKTVLKGRSLQAVFLANNTAIVERMVRTSELQRLLPATQVKLESYKKRASEGYLVAWKDVSMQLLDVQYTNKQRPHSASGGAIDSAAVLKSMNTKEKENIKEKFKNFNLAFDDLVAKHKSAYKLEPEVRRQLTKDVTGLIEPLYTRFWDRYHEVDKGKGKYVKYDKTQLSGLMASLG